MFNFFKKRTTNEKRDVILHSHIFKNAGTTFDHTLEKNFPKNFVDHREDKDLIEGRQSYLNNFLDKNSNIKAFSSHSVHLKAKNNEKYNFHQIYFLRHPIERIRSVYTFERQQPVEISLGAKMAKELDMNEYIRWRMRDDVAATIRNCHTLFLSGLGPNPNKMDEKYKVAKKNIYEVPLIGIVDRYDESMVVFEDYLREYFPNIDLSYVRKNVTDTSKELSVDEKSDELLQQIDKDLRQLVIDKNAYDIEIYKLANDLLDEKVAKVANFEKKLRDFRERCSLLQRGKQAQSEKSKKNVILHIWRHKSGTSSLQKFLCENEEALGKRGFYYPKSLRRQIAHHPLAYCYNNNLKSQLTIEDVNEIEKFWKEILHRDNIIISSEAFQNISPKSMALDFKNFDLTVVIYLRDQISYLLSSYAQAIKARKVTCTLKEYEKTIFRNVDYYSFIKKWEKAFPNAKIKVDVFDKKSLLDGDIRKDFLVKNNICSTKELGEFDFVDNDQNPSIGGSLLEFKRLLNFTDFEATIDEKKLYKILQTLASENESYKLKKTMPKKLFEDIQEKYKKTNQKVSQEYLSGKLINFEVITSFGDQFVLDRNDLESILQDIESHDKNVADEIREKYAKVILNKLGKNK
ncbi:MAG: sulfotransferase family 2 domain-containing protein [Arcobacteraceae bacterium]